MGFGARTPWINHRPFSSQIWTWNQPSCSLGLGAQGLLASRQPHPAQAQRSGRGRQPGQVGTLSGGLRPPGCGGLGGTGKEKGGRTEGEYGGQKPGQQRRRAGWIFRQSGAWSRGPGTLCQRKAVFECD